jgi:hypothetical protein
MHEFESGAISGFQRDLRTNYGKDRYDTYICRCQEDYFAVYPRNFGKIDFLTEKLAGKDGALSISGTSTEFHEMIWELAYDLPEQFL